MRTATLVKALDYRPDGKAALYLLSHPITFQGMVTSYVVVSAIPNSEAAESLNILLDLDTNEPETYIFAADEEGEWLSATEIVPGSIRGTMDHSAALKDLGYIIRTEVN